MGHHVSCLEEPQAVRSHSLALRTTDPSWPQGPSWGAVRQSKHFSGFGRLSGPRLQQRQGSYRGEALGYQGEIAVGSAVFKSLMTKAQLQVWQRTPRMALPWHVAQRYGVPSRGSLTDCSLRLAPLCSPPFLVSDCTLALSMTSRLPVIL
jgi:hypothetical protein